METANTGIGGGVLTSNPTASHWERIVNNKIRGIGRTAEELFNAAVEYFMWCDANPIYCPELIRNGELAGRIIYLPKPRAYSLEGLCMDLGITPRYMQEISKGKNDNEYFMAVKTIMGIIKTQNLEYALAGVFSQVITIKHLRLDKDTGDGQIPPPIQINVMGEAPKLLSNESEIEIPKRAI